MKPLNARLVMGLCVFGLAACTVGPDFHRPVASLPKRWTTDTPPSASRTTSASAPVSASASASASPARALASRIVDGNLDPQWWAVFQDAELSSLVERVAKSSLDVKTASTRLMQARAARRTTGAEAAPAVSGAASYQHARSSQDGLLDISGSNGKSDYNVWQPGIDASWELDLSGRIRREIESADAGVEMGEDLRRDVLLSAMAETASNYVRLRGVQAQQDIVRQNLDIAHRSFELTRIRFADGVATRLDVAEAAAQVSTIEAQLPQWENRRVRLVNALSYLLAAPPRALDSELRSTAAIPLVPPRVPVGLPSALAERRPDVREAEARLHAATANIGAAVGDFYPRITLSANLSVQSMRFDDLDEWSARMFGIGPALSVPIFEGGRLKGQLALRQAQQQEAAIQFQRTVLKAWHEVDDAMSDYDASQLYRDSLSEAVEQNHIALENAQRQYIAGATDFVNVLTVQKDLLSAQQALAVSSTDVSVSLVGLFKALGGGWETTFPVVSAVAANGNAP